MEITGPLSYPQPLYPMLWGPILTQDNLGAWHSLSLCSAQLTRLYSAVLLNECEPLSPPLCEWGKPKLRVTCSMSQTLIDETMETWWWLGAERCELAAATWDLHYHPGQGWRIDPNHPSPGATCQPSVLIPLCSLFHVEPLLGRHFQSSGRQAHTTEASDISPHITCHLTS